MKQKVVIIGHSFSSRLSIIRSVAQIGCEVSVIVMTNSKRNGKTLNNKKPIDCYSKYVSHIYYCLRKDKEELIRILLEHCTDSQQKVVLFPDSDDTVAAIDNSRNRLAEHFYFPHICNGSGSIAYWMDKIHQKEAARSVGLNVADGIVINIKDGEYVIPDGMAYPCYTKPLATMNGGKGGMHRCDNETELKNALNEYITTRARTGNVLVEEYKEIDTEYALLGFSDGKEVVIPGMMQLLIISKKNKGIALQGKVMPVDSFEEVIDKFKQLVLRIGFVGVFDIDFYKSGHLIYFCEMNLRFGGSGYAVTKMGCNLPAMMVQYFTGGDMGIWKKHITGEAIYTNERMCLDDWTNGYITLDEYQRYMKTADIHFIQDDDDPQPQKVYQRTFLAYRLRMLVKTQLSKFRYKMVPKKGCVKRFGI
jgi:carbamoylphosphate synthase large subunit